MPAHLQVGPIHSRRGLNHVYKNLLHVIISVSYDADLTAVCGTIHLKCDKVG